MKKILVIIVSLIFLVVFVKGVLAECPTITLSAWLPDGSVKEEYNGLVFASEICPDSDGDGYDICSPNAGELGDDGNPPDCVDDLSISDKDSGFNCLTDLEQIKKLRDEGKLTMEYCFNDTNNNGVGDYASCSYCINPGRYEDVDNIDNNCGGSSQGLKDINGDGKYVAGVDWREGCTLESGKYQGDGGLNDSLSNFGSPFGGKDNFCQMVDESFFVIYSGEDWVEYGYRACGEYSRAVKWGSAAKLMAAGLNVACKDIDNSTSAYKFCGCEVNPKTTSFCKMNKYELYVYKPAGLGDIGFYINNDGTVNYNKDSPFFINPFFNIYAPYGVNYNAYAGIYEVNVLSMNKGYVPGSNNEFKVYYTSPIKTFYAESEKQAKKRNTTDLYEQFIDSAFGELDYYGFINNEKVKSILAQKENDKPIFEWIKSCVTKDKCADGGSSSDYSNILTTEPYGYFLRNQPDIYYTDPEKGYQDVKVPKYEKGIPVRLIDVDDPSCKYNDVPSSVDTLPEHNWPTDYLKRPYSDSDQNKVYCYDKDGDGFCGKPTTVEKTIFNVPYGPPNKNSNTPSVCDSCFVAPGVSIFPPTYYLYNLKLSNDGIPYASAQFPDCVDAPVSGQSVAFSVFDSSTKTVIPVKSAYIGGDTNPMSEKDVHPLANMRYSATCNLNYYDFNCNKGGVDGYNFASLYLGGTPFDWDLQTGIENYDFPWWSGAVNQDAVCELVSPMELAKRELGTYSNIQGAFGLASLGLMFIPGMQLPILVLGAGMGVNDLVLGAMFTKSAAGNLGDGQTAFAFGNIVGGSVAVAGSVVGLTAYNKLKINAAKNAASADTLKATSTTGQEATQVQKELDKIDDVRQELATTGKVATEGGCFLANTSITLADRSLKNIQDVLVGDYVEAFDLETGKIVNASVTTTFVRNASSYRIINYEVIE